MYSLHVMECVFNDAPDFYCFSMFKGDGGGGQAPEMNENMFIYTKHYEDFYGCF